MPKLLSDEKLFTPEQIIHFKQRCVCGATFGEHRAEGLNCPLQTAQGFAADERFRLSQPLTPADRLNRKVLFNQSRGETLGVVIEIVPGNGLPKTKLRHLADKRRDPNTLRRPNESYVVEMTESEALNDLRRPVPKRDRLFWPKSVTFVSGDIL